jgi:hypothetical protein
MAKALGVVRTGGMAALILAWTVGGEVKLAAVVLLALLVVHHVVALAAGFVVYALVELAFCTWVDRNWDGWEAKAGPRMRKKIDKWRSGRVMRHVAGWITGGTGIVYGIASLIAMFVTDAVVVVTVARMLSGQRLGRGRVLWTCLAAATAFTIYAAIAIYGILEIEHVA